MDAFQSLIAEHCEDRVFLVHNQPPSLSAAAVTAPGRFRPHFTSFRRSRPWNLHRQRCFDEVSRRENGIGLLLGTASTAVYPSVSVKICSSVVGVVSRPLAAGLQQFGNSTLAGVSSHLLSRLQSVRNAAARLIFSSSKFRHITSLFRQLHWLKAPERTTFKQSGQVNFALSKLANFYQHPMVLSNTVQPHTSARYVIYE